MLSDQIIEIGIDESERLYVMPQAKRFPYIYREAMEVQWDAVRSVLRSPRPREWSYLRWFQQIVCAAKEQGVRLEITQSTKWSNVSEVVRSEIEAFCIV
jgi:hypothetical protein